VNRSRKALYFRAKTELIPINQSLDGLFCGDPSGLVESNYLNTLLKIFILLITEMKMYAAMGQLELGGCWLLETGKALPQFRSIGCLPRPIRNRRGLDQ